MRIPGGIGSSNSQFGNRGPDRMGPVQLDTRGMGAEMQGVADLAQGVAHGAAALRQVHAQDQADTEELARAKAANGVLTYEQRVRSKQADLESRRLSGDLSLEDYEPTARAELDEIEKPEIPGLDPASAEHYTGGLTRARMAADESIGTTVRGARREAIKGQVAAISDNLGKLPSDPGADVEKIIAQHAAMAPAYQSAGEGGNFPKLHQAFADKAWYDNAKAQLVVARDSVDGLNALEQAVTAKDGRYAGKLDAEKQNTLLTSIQVRRGQLEAQTAAKESKIEAGADRAIATLEQYQAQGIVPPVDTLDDLRAKVAGSSREAEWDGLLTGLAEAHKIAQLPPDDQLRYVEQMEAKAAGRITLAQKRNIDTVRTNYEANKKQLREDPLGYDARVQGYTVPPLNLEGLLTGDPSAMQAQLAGRMELVASARKRYGVDAGISPLRPEEAKAVAGAIDRQAPGQVTKFYGNLRRMFSDDAAYLAVMGQVAPDSPVRAAAGVIALSNPKGADLVVRGEALLNPSKADGKQDGKGGAFPMPPQSEFETKLAAYVGDAFADRGPAYQRALQVVRAGYAGAAATDGDMSGEMDEQRVQNVVNATLGTPVEFGSQTVLAPMGMDADRFSDALEAAWNAAGKPEGAGDLDAYRLVQRGSGVFYLERGKRFLYGTDGKPLQLVVK